MCDMDHESACTLLPGAAGGKNPGKKGAAGKGAGGGGGSTNGSSGGAGGEGSGGVVIVSPATTADGLPFCAGFKVSTSFGCDEVTDLDKCPKSYTDSAGRHLQCGVSGKNCLAIGPFCGE